MRPQIHTKEFNYHLPDESIAKYPLEKRSDSKLLFYKNGVITQDHFNNIDKFLPKDSLLVFNNTKVIRARLLFRKFTGAQIELFCLEPEPHIDTQIAFSQQHKSSWACIVGNLKKWKHGEIYADAQINNLMIRVHAKRLNGIGDTHQIEFTWKEDVSFGEIIEAMGKIPIPPYLNRETETIDTERYQTVYSVHQGSVAAPTAGLHFTPDVLKNLESHGHRLAYLTLHVGAGTFKPLKSTTIDGHEMHTEHFKIDRQLVVDLLNNKSAVVAVGTTTTRTLESLYWLGHKIHQGNFSMKIHQWDPYETSSTLTYTESLNAVLHYMNSRGIEAINASTGIMIAPGYEFKIINGLITNFHQPQSTLLLLLAAFMGDDWRRMYDYALKNQFRFLSYGDSSLIMNDE